MPQPGAPVSLKSPEASTAAGRTARADIKANDAADPTASNKGFNTLGHRWVHIMIELPDAATNLDWELWLWDRVSEKWYIDTRNGTNGTVTLLSTAVDNPQINMIEIAGVERVWIKIDNISGVFTNGANVWLAGSGKSEQG